MKTKLFATASVVLLIAASVCAFAYAGFDGDEGQDETYDEVVTQFLELSKVPRSCYNNEKIGAYLMNFAREHGMYCEMDSVGNVLIDHPGKTDTGLILQGHMDMVAVTDEGVVHDWTKDPLDVYIEDGTIRARGTSLGADNGAGMAIMLCALKSPEMSDIAFRCIFTVDEDVGFIGAKAMNPEWVHGYKYLVNIDNETEGEMLIGCAGGLIADVVYAADTEPIDNAVCYILNISGLAGGHSALKIRNNANAILVACDYLDRLDNVRIVSIDAGLSSNVIPSSSTFVFAVPQGTDVWKAAEDVKAEFNEKFVRPGYEGGIDIKIDLCEIIPKESWSEESTDKFLNAMLTCPNGLFDEFEYGFLSSSNIGTVRTSDDGECVVSFFCRALFTEDLQHYSEKIIAIFEKIRCRIAIGSVYEGWFEELESPIIEKGIKAFEKVYGERPVITVTHGGLECAFFQVINPNLMQISVGPTIYDAHSTDEALDVESLIDTKELVFAIVKIIADDASSAMLPVHL